ncbi:TonB-dependent receptor family protein [bacterium]|nr:TonB-dependent receptor family protein [bacterium]
MMKIKWGIIILASLIFETLLFANVEEKAGEYGVVKGKVFDKKSKAPIEYATVAVYRTKDNSVVTGTISDEKGEFKISGLKPGSFYIVVSFLGYDDTRFDDVKLEKVQKLIDLGSISIKASTKNIGEVEVVADRQSVQYKIDKKIVSVGKQMTSASLSAVEVLENVPSIRVDIEGNVSLRGSSGITLLIDGKPTVLDVSDALRQIPASTIENIEIITNPSAKYQPDGTGGIINIVSKKNRLQGVQGLFNVKAGSYDMYGGDFLLNYRKEKSNFYLGADYNNQPSPGESYSERQTYTEPGIFSTEIISEGTNDRMRKGLTVQAGWDWEITKSDAFSVGLRFGDYDMNRSSVLDYYTLNADHSETEQTSINYSDRVGQYYSITGNYTHKFAKKGQDLSAQLNYRNRDGDENSSNRLFNQNDAITDGTITTEKGPSGRWEMRLDYVHPFNEKNKLEAGFQGRSGENDDDTQLYSFVTDSFDFVHQTDKGNITSYDRNIYALYTVYKGEIDKLGYQLGLRGEYTLREIATQLDNQSYKIDRLDYFPTVHLSYHLPSDQQLMSSYSRRVDRPRGHYLEPFITWEDMFNVRLGKADLLPEFIDAMELGYLKQWEKSQFSLEGYYRITHNKVEKIKGVYNSEEVDDSKGVFLNTIDNVGTDYSLGFETMFNSSILKWWSINAMGSMYDYRIVGEKNGESFESTSFNWSGRLSNTFKLAKTVQLQLDGDYNSPTVTSQGRTEGYSTMNTAVRADFFDRKFSAVVQVRDVFGTSERVSISEDSDFYSYSRYTRNSPVFSFTLSYRLNNFMQKKKKGLGGGSESMEEDF